VHQATDRPQCAFRRDWSQGPAMKFPEFATLRSAARLLRVESILLALDGRYAEAVENQARGFRIAAHIAPDGTLIACLVAVACEAITLAGLEDILYLAGPKAEVAERVRSVIATDRPGYSLNRALKGEVLLQAETMRILRQHTYLVLDGLTGHPTHMDRATRKQAEAVAWSPVGRKFWRLLTDAGEADLLRRMRRMLAIIQRPYPARRSLIQAWDADLESRSGGAVGVFAALFLPSYSQMEVKIRQIRAAELTLMIGAAVLAFRDRRGQWPDQLEEVDFSLPRDPFDNRSLTLRRDRDGFVVFSVGAEGHYDGGKPDEPRDPRQAVFRYPAPPPRPPAPAEPATTLPLPGR
jgi:hypothetical protein